MAAILIVTVLYAGFALWDNHQVYNAVEDVVSEMRELRTRMDASKAVAPAPAETLEVEAGEAEAAGTAEALPVIETLSVIEAQPEAAEPVVVENHQYTGTMGQNESASIVFSSEAAIQTAPDPEPVLPVEQEEINPLLAELKAINEDVTGWLIMDGTAIDYPVLQGETNYSYINTDVNGNFALAGSIFLDSRNDEDYLDPYSLLYGHDMSKHRMFGDVNLYKDEKFFEENTTGSILLKDGEHILTTLACTVTAASDSGIFNIENWKFLDEEGIIAAVQEKALHVNAEGIEKLKALLEDEQPPRILALSTCTSEFTDARTILLTLIE